MADDAPAAEAEADAEMPTAEPTADAPATDAVPSNAITAALLELKRVVDEAAEVAPASAAKLSTAALLKLPVLQEPLNADAIAAELLSSGAHIRLLQSESKRQRKRIEELNAEVVRLRKPAGEEAAPAVEESSS